MQLENSHGGFAGKSLVNRIQDSLDKGMCDFREASGTEALKLQGYVAGMAKALGIIRGTSVQTEINESRARMNESSKNVVEVIEDATGVGFYRNHNA